MKPLYSGHPWDVANWLLYKGGLIIQCTFNREVHFGTLGGCFREVTFLCDMAALDRFHCSITYYGYTNIMDNVSSYERSTVCIITGGSICTMTLTQAQAIISSTTSTGSIN